MVNNGRQVEALPVDHKTVYLRVSASNVTQVASFDYSLDGKRFKHLGNWLIMDFSLKIFTGNKFCLFTYPTLELGGYVDFDWFRVGEQERRMKLVEGNREFGPIGAN